MNVTIKGSDIREGTILCGMGWNATVTEVTDYGDEIEYRATFPDGTEVHNTAYPREEYAALAASKPTRKGE